MMTKNKNKKKKKRKKKQRIDDSSPFLSLFLSLMHLSNLSNENESIGRHVIIERCRTVTRTSMRIRADRTVANGAENSEPMEPETLRRCRE